MTYSGEKYTTRRVLVGCTETSRRTKQTKEPIKTEFNPKGPGQNPDMMKRKGKFSERIETIDNFRLAFEGSSQHKHKRPDIAKFELDLEINLFNLLHEFSTETFKTSEYTYFTVHEPKPREISKLPYPDHVMHWAVLNVIDNYIKRTFIRNTFSCIKGRGTHDLFKRLQKDLYFYDPNKTYYVFKGDIQKFYDSIFHDVAKRMVRRLIKDKKLLRWLDEVIDSKGEDKNLPIGTKIAQLLSNLILSLFDFDVKNCFYILNSPSTVAHYTQRYINEKIDQAHTKEDYEELSKGSIYLAEKYNTYLKNIKLYYRYADDFVVLHEDKIFLHHMIEWMGIYLAHELKLTIKHNWQIFPITSRGIDYVGYVFYHDHVKLRKRNKVALCKQVAALRKKGLSDEEIRLKSSSRIGFASHANTKNLIRTLKMEKRLGELIRKRRMRHPFEDLSDEHKKKIGEIIYDTTIVESRRGKEDEFLILLEDFKIELSALEKEKDGSPRRCIALRYKLIDHVEINGDKKEYIWQEKEWYSFSGSRIMIEQAEDNFSKEDLPIATVITLYQTNKGANFTKFT